MNRRSIFSRLYNGETNFDFYGRRRLWFALSLAVILVGALSLATRGLNLGIDFTGGTAWELPAGDASINDAREALEPLGLADARIQLVGGDRLRVQADTPEGEATAREERVRKVSAALAEASGASVRQVSVNEVGPSWGEEITAKAQRALVFFLIAITLYITLRFEWKMALATLAALFHDILVTVGVYSLTGFEVTPATVIALLTILGYSIYDGIVVFDKIEENTRGLAASGRMTYGEMVNVSLNEVLMRSLNTSITALLPILSLLVVGSFLLGAATLQDFALALLVGLAASAYSSIFIASPVLGMLKEREPRYASIRERLAARGGTGGGLLTPSAVTVGSATAPDEPRSEPTPVREAQAATRYGSGPRPRKKKRR